MILDDVNILTMNAGGQSLEGGPYHPRPVERTVRLNASTPPDPGRYQSW